MVVTTQLYYTGWVSIWDILTYFIGKVCLWLGFKKNPEAHCCIIDKKSTTFNPIKNGSDAHCIF